MSGSKTLKHPKQEQFCLEYMKDLNATQAAIRAGYAERTAKQTGSHLLSKLDIKKRIEFLTAERSNKVKIDSEYILSQLGEMQQALVVDIINPQTGEYRDIREWPDVWQRMVNHVDVIASYDKDGVVTSVTHKVKLIDRAKIIEMLGKHTKVNSFVNNHSHNLGDETIEKINLNDTERAARLHAIIANSLSKTGKSE